MNKKQNKQQPFDYNAKIMSLTKEKICLINKDLNETIRFMQNDINNLKYEKETQNEFYLKKIEKFKIEQLSLLEYNLHLQKKITYQKKSNSRFIKQLIFLNNRNFFQRLFNIQYPVKENE